MILADQVFRWFHVFFIEIFSNEMFRHEDRLIRSRSAICGFFNFRDWKIVAGPADPLSGGILDARGQFF